MAFDLDKPFWKKRNTRIFTSVRSALFIAMNQAEGSAIIIKAHASRYSFNVEFRVDKGGNNEKEKKPAIRIKNPAERAIHPTTSRRGIRKNAPVLCTP